MNPNRSVTHATGGHVDPIQVAVGREPAVTITEIELGKVSVKGIQVCDRYRVSRRITWRTAAAIDYGANRIIVPRGAYYRIIWCVDSAFKSQTGEAAVLDHDTRADSCTVEICY